MYSTPSSPGALKMATPQIEVVESRRQRDEFAAFPWKVYEGDRYWVPSLFWDRQRFLDPKHNPFFEHSDVRLFIARQGGEVVGTVAGIVNHNHNAFHNEKTGHFGLFEVYDDPDVARALLDAASDYVKGLGMDTVVGPMNMSTNDECGLLIDGFDSPPVAMMTYNPRYYGSMITGYGFEKVMDLYAYLIDTNIYGPQAENLPHKIVQGAEKLLQDGVVTVRKAQMSSFEDELVRAKAVYNSAWGRNWGFVPMTDPEIEHLAHGLKHLIDPDMVLFAEHDGRPVGIAVALPDVNEALLRVYPRPGGFLRFLYDGARFLWAKRTRPRLFRLLIMGVIEEYRNRGIDGVFYVEVAKAALAKGYRQSEMSWILENNVMMNRIIKRLGGHVYKTYRVYGKSLT